MFNINKEFILHGDEIETDIPISLGEFIKLILETHDDKVLQVDADTGEEITAKYILKKSIRLARWLQSKKLGPGDAVAIISENRLEFCLIPVATYLTGITLVPLNPAYTIDELQHILNLSKPKIIFASPSSLNRIVSVVGANQFIENVVVFGRNPHKQHSMVLSLEHALNATFLDTLESEEYIPPEVNIEENVAAILCSSGTTGLPKGVMVTQKNILTLFSSVKQLTNKDILDDDDSAAQEVAIGIMPFFHSMGFMILNLVLCGGRKIIVVKKFNARQFLQIIQDYKVSILAIPPPLVVMLCETPFVDQYDLSSLKEVRVGAAPLSPEYEKKIKEKFKLNQCGQGYGMTETTLSVLYLPVGQSKLSSIGKIVPGMSVKVIDENGRALGPNKEGELCFKGPLIMKGYVNDPTATANTIDKDGWLRTGDVGYYDDDGYFFIVDRIKELIKYKAYQVPPAELEAVLMSHPDIIDAAVIGLPDKRAGELPLAFVVLKPFSKLSSAQIQDFMKGKVSPQKQLRGGVRFVEEIPRNASGKILRRVLKKAAIEHKSKL